MAGQMELETKQIESNYQKWLEMSGMSEPEFFKFRTVGNFKILDGTDEQNDYKIIVLGYMNKNDDFVKIGEQFAYKKGDVNGYLDLSLVLLYIASRLDIANNKAPAFEQRKNYFSEITKAFLKTLDEFASAKK